MDFISLQIPTDIWLRIPGLARPKATRDLQAQMEFCPSLVEVDSCY